MRSITPTEPIDYLVIGHITQDLTPTGPKMGGTAAYAALTAHALGLNVGVVTSWGNEVALGMMNMVSIVNTPAKQSTTFQNEYRPEGRIQILHHKANDLHFDNVPLPWRHAPLVHLGPVAQEVDLSLTAAFPHALVGITPQGWLRDWDQDGRVFLKAWSDENALLDHADATVISLEDVNEDEDIIQEMAAVYPVFVATEGYKGARVFWHGDVRRVHAPKVEEVDATGAGDIFAAAFFVQYHKTRDPWEAARFANQLAAQSVTRPGLAGIPRSEEIQSARIEVL